MKRGYLFLKRLSDILISLILIMICILFLWWWILPINFFVTNGHPFFAQRRYGQNKKIFKIIKFRSMKIGSNPELPPFKMSGRQQYEMTTRFGFFLRQTQLDETLQLFNIFVGSMSFVGPRPGAVQNEEELVAEREKYSPNIFSVRPGLTGLSQIELLDKHNPIQKAKMDFEYIQKASFYFDCAIFCKTILLIIKRTVKSK